MPGILGVVLLIFISGCGVELRQDSPDFKLPTAKNPDQSVHLSQIVQDSPVLLVFWATWCPSCAEEVPVLNEWNERFRRDGLQVVGINVEESRDDIRAFQKDYPMDYSVLLDEGGKAARQFGVTGLPTTVFLAKGGEIRYYGFSLPRNMEQLLQNT